MMIKTTVELPDDLLDLIDLRARKTGTTRSEVIEAVLRKFATSQIVDDSDQRDLSIINTNADFLNREAADVLLYQVPV